MRIFVAGASGTFGTRLVPQLLERGHEVLGTARSPGGVERTAALGAEPLVLDLLDLRAARTVVAAAEPDAIVHQALEHDGPAVYNIVDDEPAPVREWLPVLAEALGAKPPRRFPRWLARLFAGEAAVMMGTESRGASNAKAKNELGWAPRHPTWRQGFVEAYRRPVPAMPMSMPAPARR